MNILIVAIESGRWGPARLPAALAAAGLSVAALCPDDNPVAASRHLARHFPLGPSRSAARMAAALGRAVGAWRPRLVVPADEQVVAFLQSLVLPGSSRAHGLDAAACRLVLESLGRAESFDAMLLKSETLALARRVGVRVPPGGTVATPAAAAALADEIGYPAYLKNSFGWAGQGVRRCDDRAAVAAAMPAPPGRLAPLRAGLRRLLGRDWYPTGTAIDLQRAIAGRPAMYCALAWRGALLAGFAGLPQETDGETGPSTVVRLGAHPAMAEAAEAMIRALGATGFIGFDFMIEDGTGQAYLLECNPRPIQVCHLGPRVGVDLAAALAAALAGQAPDPRGREPSGEAVVALFPQLWRQDPARFAACAALADLPWEDPGLLRRMVTEVAPDALAACNGAGAQPAASPIPRRPAARNAGPEAEDPAESLALRSGALWPSS
jgi:hypothetical protein